MEKDKMEKIIVNIKQ